MFKTLIVLVIFTSSFAYANIGAFNKKVVIENAYKVIKQVVPKSHPEFWPKSPKDINILRLERAGVIDFMYTSENGKFRGNVYCSLTQLIKYNEKYSSLRDTCFRANIYKRNDKAINKFGEQVGIY